MQCSVFTPSHITGFFEIIEHTDPIKKGSRGAGFALDNGVNTTVTIKEGIGKIKISSSEDDLLPNDPVSCHVLHLIQKRFPNSQIWSNNDIMINHDIKVPIEAGFGVSAGISLGTALGLVKLLDLPLTFNQAAAVAHQAEVELKTGLGDVIGAVEGGVPLRLSPGAPGVGKTDKINHDDFYVLTKNLGVIETSSIIGNPLMVEKINSIAYFMLNKLIENPKIPHLIRLSKEFSIKTGLMDPEIKEIVNILEEETLGASMAMLGKTAFAISETPDCSVEGVQVHQIDDCGCRFI